MASNRIRTYQPEEAVSINLAQSGFDMLSIENTAIQGLTYLVAEFATFGSQRGVSINSPSDLNGSISSTVTSITVDDQDHFEAGNYISINSEVMKVNRLGTGEVLEVIRGMFGTTAASHGDGAVINYFSPSNSKYWAGIRNISVDTTFAVPTMLQCELIAQTYKEDLGSSHDDLSRNSVYSPTDYVNYVTMATEDVIYGKFDKVSVEATSSANSFHVVKLIRG